MDNLQVIGTYAQVIANIAATVTLVLTVYALRKTVGYNRGDHLLKLHEIFLADSEMSRIYYSVEYDRFRYVSEQFHGSKDEQALDRLLGFFDNLGRLRDMQLLRDKDVEFFGYELATIANNREISSYLASLADYAKNAQRPDPYASLRGLISQRRREGAAFRF